MELSYHIAYILIEDTSSRHGFGRAISRKRHGSAIHSTSTSTSSHPRQLVKQTSTLTSSDLPSRAKTFSPTSTSSASTSNKFKRLSLSRSKANQSKSVKKGKDSAETSSGKESKRKSMLSSKGLRLSKSTNSKTTKKQLFSSVGAPVEVMLSGKDDKRTKDDDYERYLLSSLSPRSKAKEKDPEVDDAEESNKPLSQPPQKPPIPAKPIIPPKPQSQPQPPQQRIPLATLVEPVNVESAIPVEVESYQCPPSVQPESEKTEPVEVHIDPSTLRQAPPPPYEEEEDDDDDDDDDDEYDVSSDSAPEDVAGAGTIEALMKQIGEVEEMEVADDNDDDDDD